ncbi:MAG TPA: helix-turn-helix domain-containing protein [Dehalococcoidia bacterium]|nr:helix-turn-helix domain-containing protein [Dehalococcoidia bacterium]
MAQVHRQPEPDLEPLERVRDDALPENLLYRDDGCEVHPHCLSCPLPRCRYEEPGGLRALLNHERDLQIRRLHAHGLRADALARRFAISRRTVFRALAKQAPAALNPNADRRTNRNGDKHPTKP